LFFSGTRFDEPIEARTIEEIRRLGGVASAAFPRRPSVV